VSDHAAIHQLDQQWRQACFDDVAAGQGDERALVLRRGGDRAYDLEAVAAYEDIGE